MAFRIFLLYLILVSFNLSFANDKELQIKSNIYLIDLINSSQEIADSKPSKYVNKKIPSSIVKIKNNEYEIRFFSFEDTLGNLSSNITFREYINKNNLNRFESLLVEPFNGIIFETFDHRRAKLGDGVYFSMAIRKIDFPL